MNQHWEDAWRFGKFETIAVGIGRGGFYHRSLTRDRQPEELIDALIDLWACSAGPFNKRPQLYCTPPRGGDSSYCIHKQYIVIADHQSCYATLLHEMTHARGFFYHGHAFCRAYFSIMEEYLEVYHQFIPRGSVDQYRILAGLCGVKF